MILGTINLDCIGWISQRPAVRAGGCDLLGLDRILEFRFACAKKKAAGRFFLFFLFQFFFPARRGWTPSLLIFARPTFDAMQVHRFDNRTQAKIASFPVRRVFCFAARGSRLPRARLAQVRSGQVRSGRCLKPTVESPLGWHAVEAALADTPSCMFIHTSLPAKNYYARYTWATTCSLQFLLDAQ